ncbi:MAG: HU family DNA-binding protein [Zoogloeaceae bacterium]|jgi:DNA-binding protein HU-beta|nr:HU family DNA-binding protein [Zoogloeaceae bacterium]
MSLKKKDLAGALADKCGISNAAADAALNGLLDVIAESLLRGESISLTGFGNFSVGERAARTGRNPKTGEALTIAASRYVKFSMGKNLKAAINEDR